jgi:hypothetical protein
MDVTRIISELRSELEHIDDSIRFMERSDRRSTRTATTAPRPVTEIRRIAKSNTTAISEPSDRLTDPPIGRVIEIRSARKPDDAA